MIKFDVLTLFPSMFEAVLGDSIIGRAREKGLIEMHFTDIRDFTENKHRKVDDYPYSGGGGMLMQAQPVYDCIEAVESKIVAAGRKRSKVIYVTPRGRVFDQSIAKEYSFEEDIIILCGHYEGIDERVLEESVTDFISIGDYVLTGGELPAMVLTDCIARLVPGVLNNADSAETESFTDGLLEYPQYSRPEVWHDKAVPEVLLSGHHKNIENWRREKSLEETKKHRPDLYEKYVANSKKL